MSRSSPFGGHRWDTAFNLQQAFPFLTTEDVDAVEVIPVQLPELPVVTVTGTTIGEEGGLIIDFESEAGVPLRVSRIFHHLDCLFAMGRGNHKAVVE